jgi:hypothetical protein
MLPVCPPGKSPEGLLKADMHARLTTRMVDALPVGFRFLARRRPWWAEKTWTGLNWNLTVLTPINQAGWLNKPRK